MNQIQITPHAHQRMRCRDILTQEMILLMNHGERYEDTERHSVIYFIASKALVLSQDEQSVITVMHGHFPKPHWELKTKLAEYSLEQFINY